MACLICCCSCLDLGKSTPIGDDKNKTTGYLCFNYVLGYWVLLSMCTIYSPSVVLRFSGLDPLTLTNSHKILLFCAFLALSIRAIISITLAAHLFILYHNVRYSNFNLGKWELGQIKSSSSAEVHQLLLASQSTFLLRVRSGFAVLAVVQVFLDRATAGWWLFFIKTAIFTHIIKCIIYDQCSSKPPCPLLYIPGGR